ncbi:uncharacterized protein V2V93DRAFT_375502 [Kockiozyma suomiensis]|uniref:uncharacterized protein n=1 Tax=Kockiozyma suomiensis TaxID=1337062 RepID=UPI003342ED4E
MSPSELELDNVSSVSADTYEDDDTDESRALKLDILRRQLESLCLQDRSLYYRPSESPSHRHRRHKSNQRPSRSKYSLSVSQDQPAVRSIVPADISTEPSHQAYTDAPLCRTPSPMHDSLSSASQIRQSSAPFKTALNSFSDGDISEGRTVLNQRTAAPLRAYSVSHLSRPVSLTTPTPMTFEPLMTQTRFDPSVFARAPHTSRPSAHFKQSLSEAVPPSIPSSHASSKSDSHIHHHASTWFDNTTPSSPRNAAIHTNSYICPRCKLESSQRGVRCQACHLCQFHSKSLSRGSERCIDYDCRQEHEREEKEQERERKKEEEKEQERRRKKEEERERKKKEERERKKEEQERERKEEEEKEQERQYQQLERERLREREWRKQERRAHDRERRYGGRLERERRYEKDNSADARSPSVPVVFSPPTFVPIPAMNSLYGPWPPAPYPYDATPPWWRNPQHDSDKDHEKAASSSDKEKKLIEELEDQVKKLKDGVEETNRLFIVVYSPDLKKRWQFPLSRVKSWNVSSFL